MSPSPLFLATLAIATFSSCCKFQAEQTTPASADRKFASQAAYTNLDAIAIGALASGRGEDATVRAFGRTTAEEHRAAQEQLKRVAEPFNLSLPADIDETGMSDLNRLSAATDATFDTTYIAIQAARYRQALTLFQTEIDKGKNNTVVNYASDQWSLLVTRLRTADSLLAAAGVK